MGLLAWLLELLLEAGMLVTVRPLDVGEGPAKLLDLGAEPIAFSTELLALGPEPVALAAEGLDLVGLLACLPELLLEAGMLVTVRPVDVVERPAKLLDLRAKPIAFSTELLALAGVARARPEPVALAAEGLDVMGLLSCLPELLLEAGMLVTVRPLDVVERPAKLLDLERSRSPSARSCSPSTRSCSPSARSRSPRRGGPRRPASALVPAGVAPRDGNARHGASARRGRASGEARRPRERSRSPSARSCSRSSPQPVALAAEGLDVLGLLACLLELLIEAGMLVTVRPLDVVERPAKLLDLEAEPIAVSTESLAVRTELLALGPKPVALAAEGLDVLGLLACLLELLLEAGQLVAMRLFDVIEAPGEVVALRAELIAIGPEATGLVSHRLLALGECRPQPLSLVQRVLSVDAETMLVGAGCLEPVRRAR